MQESHGISIQSSVHSFDTFANFLQWKRNEETSTKSYFIQHCGPTSSSSIRHHYYYCSRSGFLGSGKRNLKCQGSSKIEATCVSHIKVDECIKNGTCKVYYTSSHTGHEMEVCYLPIPHDLKARVAVQLHEGVSVSRIMDDIRNMSESECITHQHLVVRQDINNIKRTLNLLNIQKHSNDQSSVAMWVKELQEQEYNPVLIFKAQGEIAGNEMDDLAKENFLLCMQTQFQKDTMAKFGNVICVDATHGTNMYDFLLITVMVTDNFGEGVPVAWAITDKEDACTLTQFFKPLYERVGNIKPKFFMSDDAQQYYNAWCGVFGNVPHKLLCMWHIDRAWRKAIQDHIAHKEAKVNTYHIMRVLLMETDEVKFHSLLQQALTHFESACPSFYQYILTQYVNRVEQWAVCHRQHTMINTNMVLESFHRVLKVVYLNHRQNRRIDNLLHVLLKINRDTIFNTLRKEEMGKVTHKSKEIIKRHTSAQQMMASNDVDIQCCEETGKWKIRSSDGTGVYYDVVLVGKNDNCHLSCPECNVWVHMFTCSCVDAVLHNTICKHIHLLHLAGMGTLSTAPMESEVISVMLQHSSNIPANSISMSPASSNIPANSISVSPASSNTPANSIPVSPACNKQTILKNIDVLKKLVLDLPNDSAEYLTEINSHLMSTISLLQAKHIYKPQLIAKRCPSPNSNNITQQRFHSTKKKKQIIAPRIAKPTTENESTVRDHLESLEPSVCSICYRTDDPSLSKEVGLD